VVNPGEFLGNPGRVGPVSAHRCGRMDIVWIPWVPWVIHAFAHSCVKAVKHKKLLFHVQHLFVRQANEPRNPKESPWIAQLCVDTQSPDLYIGGHAVEVTGWRFKITRGNPETSRTILEGRKVTDASHTPYTL
jgi:hypothetical protein